MMNTDNTTNNENGDEDDHDPEEITIDQAYDLALIKTVVSTGPFNAGDDVLYAIEVCNQGFIDANNIEVTDYFPDGLSLSILDVNGWMNSGSNVTNVVPSLTAGECTTLNIILTIDTDFTGTSIVNYAEITEDDGDDIDSSADSNDTNDSGGEPGGDTDDVTDNSNGDEDDHDPAEIAVEQIYDLALTKTLSSQPPFAPGDDVTYMITVINQGTVNAANIEVTDYLPTGLSLSVNDANGWTSDGVSATITVSSLAAGEDMGIPIILTIDPNFMGTQIINYAEISNDDDGDADSTTDDDPNNDGGGNPNGATDNTTNGDGSDEPGGNDPAGDEDDHDPEVIEIGQVYDLALTKILSSSPPF